MYYDFSIKIPEEKGKIIIKKKGNAAYVLYQYSSEHNPEKKYAVPKRVIIGKIDPEREGYMYPNEKCQEHFADLCVPDELPESYRSCCLKIGSYAVIQRIYVSYDLTNKNCQAGDIDLIEISKITDEIIKLRRKEELLTEKLHSLQKQKKDYEVKQVMDAFQKSGKSLQELLTFLQV